MQYPIEVVRETPCCCRVVDGRCRVVINAGWTNSQLTSSQVLFRVQIYDNYLLVGQKGRSDLFRAIVGFLNAIVVQQRSSCYSSFIMCFVSLTFIYVESKTWRHLLIPEGLSCQHSRAGLSCFDWCCSLNVKQSPCSIVTYNVMKE